VHLGEAQTEETGGSFRCSIETAGVTSAPSCRVEHGMANERAIERTQSERLGHTGCMSALAASVIGLVGVVIVGGLMYVGLRGERPTTANGARGTRTAVLVWFAGSICGLVIALSIASASDISRASAAFKLLVVGVVFAFGTIPAIVIAAVSGYREGQERPSSE
jgi:hypothetical protein